MSRKRSLGHNPLGEASRDATVQQMVGGATPKAPASPGRHAMLVLCGRGAEAAVEVGALQELAATAASPQRVVAAGVGAFNAAVLTARWREGWSAAAEELERIWRQRIAGDGPADNGLYRFRGDPEDFANPLRFGRQPLAALRHAAGDGAFFARNWIDRSVRMLRSDGSLSHRMFAAADLSMLVSNEPFHELAEECIDLAALVDSPLELAIFATNWHQGGCVASDAADLAAGGGRRRLSAAVALAGIFPAVSIDGEDWHDTVATSELLSAASTAGADCLHVIEPAAVDENGQRANSSLAVLERSARRRAADSLEEGLRRLEIANRLARAEERPPVVVHRYRAQLPVAAGSSVLDCSPARIDTAIAAGRRAVLEHDCRHAGCLLSQVGDS